MLRVGVVVWLASELMFFAGLFAGYFALRAVNHDWPPEGVELDAARTAAATAVLVASSFTMHLAVVASERRNERGAVRWTVATVVLGALFVANQAAEYAGLGFTYTTHAYGSIFYLMTGFHGLHVIGGLVLMLAVLAVGVGRTSRLPLEDPLTVTEFYWHFVDVVWLAMFATIYLLR
ncbi:MAG: heme-copper oxidase subunit III [Actinobacteria bacterium]|nr:heme-copper oxidase subunit III [Actinomycetota bacterium]MBW3649321.1 heme-copper oxidase subunit III [Actinomycetota bacterium]